MKNGLDKRVYIICIPSLYNVHRLCFRQLLNKNIIFNTNKLYIVKVVSNFTSYKFYSISFKLMYIQIVEHKLGLKCLNIYILLTYPHCFT